MLVATGRAPDGGAAVARCRQAAAPAPAVGAHHAHARQWQQHHGQRVADHHMVAALHILECDGRAVAVVCGSGGPSGGGLAKPCVDGGGWGRARPGPARPPRMWCLPSPGHAAPRQQARPPAAAPLCSAAHRRLTYQGPCQRCSAGPQTSEHPCQTPSRPLLALLAAPGWVVLLQSNRRRSVRAAAASIVKYKRSEAKFLICGAQKLGSSHARRRHARCPPARRRSRPGVIWRGALCG